MSFLIPKSTWTSPTIEIIDDLVIEYKGNKLRYGFIEVVERGNDY